MGGHRMPRSSTPASLAIGALVLVVLPLAAMAGESKTPDWTGWLNGATGMSQAAKLHEQDSKPVFVYFYTDWCQYCRQFERELLSTEEVADFVGDLIAVRINPEASAENRHVADMYRVNGFPALFVHSGESRTLTRVDRVVVEGGAPRLMVPAEFVASLREAGSR